MITCLIRRSRTFQKLHTKKFHYEFYASNIYTGIIMASSRKKKVAESFSRASQRVSVNFSQAIQAMDSGSDSEKENGASRSARQQYDNELSAYDRESRALLTNPRRASRDHHDYDDDESSLATIENLWETRVKVATTLKARKMKAAKRLKLDDAEVKRIVSKETTRDEWEKHFNQRQHRRYWRHKATGITKWERPYVNLDINGEEDSTDESLYGGEEASDDSDSRRDTPKKKKNGEAVPVAVDHGVWVEKYNKKYDTKYWRNKDTMVLSWSKPPRSGVSPTKQPGRRSGSLVKKVPVTSYIYLKDESYIETRKEMSERLSKEWKEKWSEEWGMPYYKHTKTKELRWDDPRVIPVDAFDGADDLDQEEAEDARRRSLSRKSMNFLLGKNAEGAGYDSGTGTGDETATDMTGTATEGESYFDTADESDLTGDEEAAAKNKAKKKGKLIGGVWRKKLNARWQCYYFKNTISGETTWNDPLLGSPSPGKHR